MRKLLSTLSLMLIVVFTVFTPVYAASVPPQLFPGNDSNPNDFTPPEGCIHYEIPDSGNVGTHTVRFNEFGEVDPQGPYIFTVVVGKEQGEDFTKVLSWDSNFPIDSVIVKVGNAFNLYQYESGVRHDTNLVSPNNPSGDPADVSHVSVVICPDEFPPPTEPTEPTEPTCPTDPTTPTNPCPPNGNGSGLGIIVVIFALLILAFFLLGLLIGSMFFYPKRRCKRYDCNGRKYCHNKEDCDHCKPRNK